MERVKKHCRDCGRFLFYRGWFAGDGYHREWCCDDCGYVEREVDPAPKYARSVPIGRFLTEPDKD